MIIFIKLISFDILKERLYTQNMTLGLDSVK